MSIYAYTFKLTTKLGDFQQKKENQDRKWTTCHKKLM